MSRVDIDGEDLSPPGIIGRTDQGEADYALVRVRYERDSLSTKQERLPPASPDLEVERAEEVMAEDTLIGDLPGGNVDPGDPAGICQLGNSDHDSKLSD